MNKEDRKIEYLKLMHDISARAKDAQTILDAIINEPEIEPEIKTVMLDIQTTVMVQDLALKNLVENMFEVDDMLTDLIGKYGK